MKPWLILGAAIAAEVAGTSFLKSSEGFTRLGPSVAVVVFYALSFGLLGQALESIDVGVAYAIWAGFGIAAVSIIGVLFFDEPISWLRFACLALIVIGAAGLHVTSTSH